MPSVSQSDDALNGYFPNRYISPFGNDGITPIYSSVPFSYPVSGDCLPCVVCGNNTSRDNILSQAATSVKSIEKNQVTIAIGA